MAAGPRRDSRVFTVVVIILVCLGALPMLLIIALSSAPAIAILATVLAAIPVVPLVLCYLWLDRYEPEPRRYKFAAFVWGGVVAVGIALALQVGIQHVFDLSDDTMASFIAPATEEPAKSR